jgi:hypothetical protein
MTVVKDDSNQELALMPAAYTGLAHVIGSTLTTSAAMLAFFFVFQGTLLANFPTLYNEFAHATLSAFGNLAVGRVALVALCLLALSFTYWSYLIVRIFIIYFESFLRSGRSLETSHGDVHGVFVALRTAYDQPGPQGRLFWTTVVFFLLVGALWLGLMSIAILGG